MVTTLVIIGALAISVSGHPFEKMLHEEQSSRIVGGVDAPEGYAPHMAALVWGATVKSLMCGGSLVSRRHILTAAHCIDPMVIWGQLIPSFRAVVGSNKWNSDNTVVRFSHYVNHPNWDWFNIKNDVGVLFLTEDLNLNDKVAVVPLSFKWVAGDVKSYATGWGRLGSWLPISESLQLLDLQTLSPERCVEGLNEASQGWGSAPPLDSEVEICTFHSIGHGMCNGDSGSALVSRETGHQIGIVSWGFPCAVGAPDVYGRISGFYEFLRRHLGKHIEYTY